MSYDNKKFILFPNLDDNTKKNLETILLPHPKSNKLCEFFYNREKNEIYEIYEHTERSNGIPTSAFLDNICISKLEFCIATKVDSIFLIISALAYARKSNMINKNLMCIISHYINNLDFEDEDRSNFEMNKANINEFYTRLISHNEIIEKIKMICDISNIKDDNKKYNLNDEKLYNYLCERINKASNICLERKIHFKEYNTILNKDSINNLSEIHIAQKIASDLLLMFISNDLVNIKDRIIKRFGELKPITESNNLENKNNKDQYICTKKTIQKNNRFTMMKSNKKSEKYAKSVNSQGLNSNIMNFLIKKKK